MVLQKSLSNSKFPQVAWTLLSILTDLYNAEVLIVSTLPLISKYSSLCTKAFVAVPRVITIDITITFMFHSFFSSPANSRFILKLLLFLANFSHCR